MDGGNSAMMLWKENKTIKNFPSYSIKRKIPNYLIIKKYGVDVFEK